MATQDPFAGIDFGAPEEAAPASVAPETDPFAGIDFAAPAPAGFSVARTLDKAADFVPDWMKAALELPGQATAAVLGPLAAGTEAYKEASERKFKEAGGYERYLGPVEKLRTLPSYSEVLRAKKIESPPLEEVKAGADAPKMGLYGRIEGELIDAATSLVGLAADIGTDPSVVMTGTAKGALAAAKGAAKAGTAVERIKSLVDAGVKLYGAPAAGAIYLPEVAGTVAHGLEEGRPGEAAGAGMMGALLLLGLKHEIKAKGGAEEDVAAELAKLKEGLAEEVPAAAAPPPPAATGKLENPLPGRSELEDILAYDRDYPSELKLEEEAPEAGTIYPGRRQARFPRPRYERPVIERRFEGGARAPVHFEGGPPTAPNVSAALEQEGLKEGMAALRPTAPSAGAALRREGMAEALAEPLVGGTAVHWGERGEIVEVTGDMVDLRMPNGKIRTVPVEKLHSLKPPKGELFGLPDEPQAPGPPGEPPGPPPAAAAVLKDEGAPPVDAVAAQHEIDTPRYPLSPSTPLEDRIGPGGHIFHPRYGELAIQEAEPDGSVWARTMDGKLVNVYGEFDVLSNDVPRPYESSPEYQRQVLAEAPDGAWPIQDAPEIPHNLRPSGKSSPEYMRKEMLKEAEAVFGDDKTPGFSLYPVLDENGVQQYAMLWRNRAGKIKAAMGVSGMQGLPPLPSELIEPARRYGAGAYTPDDVQAIMEWWKTAYHDNPNVKGGEVDMIAVDPSLPRDLQRTLVRRMQTEASRHRVERKPDHLLSTDGARSLNGQRVTRDELSAAAQAVIWAPEQIVGRIRFPDTGRPLTQGEIVRGLADLAQAAEDPAAFDRQFHYEASAVKRFFRALVAAGPDAYEKTVGVPLADLPPDAHITSQRRPDGGVDLSIADRRGAPLIREEARDAQAAREQGPPPEPDRDYVGFGLHRAASERAGGPPGEPGAGPAPGEGTVPGGPPREPGGGSAAGNEPGGRVSGEGEGEGVAAAAAEPGAPPKLTRVNLLDAATAPANLPRAPVRRTARSRRSTVSTEPPRSAGHVAFAGDSEFFTVTDSQGQQHLYRAPAQSTLDPTGVRTGARWFGPATEQTIERITEIARNFLRAPTEAEAKLAKARMEARRANWWQQLHAGIPLTDLSSEVLDLATILGYRGVKALADYKQWKAQLPPSMQLTSDKLLRMVHSAMLREGIGLGGAQGAQGAAQPLPGGPPAEPPPSSTGQPAGPPDSPPGAPLGTGTPNVPPIPKYAGSINLWQRIDYGEDALQVIQDVARQFKPLIDEARRGKLTVDTLQKLAHNLNMTTEQMLRRRRGQAWNAEHLMAADKILKESTTGVVEMAREYVQTPMLKRTLDQQLELLRAIQTHVAIQAQMSGAASEAGRALGILNRLRYAVGNREAVQGLLDQFGKTKDQRHIEMIAELMSKMDPRNILALGKFAREVAKPTWRDKIYEAFINAILSGPPTHVSNAFSGLLGLVLKPVEAGAAAAVNVVLHGVSKIPGGHAVIPRERYFGEVLHTAKELLPFEYRKLKDSDASEIGIRQGFRDAAAAALQAFRTEEPVVGREGGGLGAELMDKPGAIPGKWGRRVRVPSRILLATDQFIEALVYRMELNAQAYRQALGEGARGVEGISRRMAEIVENPSDLQKDAAVKEALYRTFNEPGGDVAETALSLRRRHKGLRWFVPFIRTPINIVKFGLERTPLRLLNPYTLPRLIDDYRKGKITTGDLSEEGAKLVTGAILALGVGEMVASGYLTGGGPSDPAERRTLEATGWKPYSLKLGNDYYSIARIEPLGVPLGMMADYVEISQRTKTPEFQLEQLPPQILHAFARNLLDKTWISGITGIFKTIYDYERWGEPFALRTLGSAIPNIIAYSARALEEERYLPETIPQTLAARVGAPLEGTPHALDIYGRIEPTEPTMIERFASPFRRSPVRVDQVTPELLRLGITLDAPSRKLNIDDLEGATMPPPAQLEILARARGLATFIRAAQVVDDPEWSALSKDEQTDYLQNEISRAKREVTISAKALVADGVPLTLDALVGDLLEEAGGPPEL